MRANQLISLKIQRLWPSFVEGGVASNAMSRHTIPYRELPPRSHRFADVARRAIQIVGWATALTALALICTVLSR